MFANILFNNFPGIDARINEDPVLSFKNFLIYELVNSAFPNDIVQTINGEYAATFRHIALDTNGNGYLYDYKNKELSGHLGPCTYAA